MEFVAQPYAHLEPSSGHKKMRMEPVARLQRKTPLKQRRSYFDSAEYFLDKQGLQPQDIPVANPEPNTVTNQLPMKLQPCQHVSQPSRLSVRT